MLTTKDLYCMCENQISSIDYSVFAAYYLWLSQNNKKPVCGNDLISFALTCKDGKRWFSDYTEADNGNRLVGVHLIQHGQHSYHAAFSVRCTPCLLEFFFGDYGRDGSYYGMEMIWRSAIWDFTEFLDELTKTERPLTAFINNNELIQILLKHLRDKCEEKKYETFKSICKFMLAKIDFRNAKVVFYFEEFQELVGKLITPSNLECIKLLHHLLIKLSPARLDTNTRRNIAGGVIHESVRQGNLEVLKFFVDQYEPESLALVKYYSIGISCARSGNIEILDYLVSLGMIVTGIELLDALGNGQFQFAFRVHEIIRYWPYSTFNILVSKSLDVDIVRTAVSLGCEPNVGAIEYILKKGLKEEKARQMIFYLLYELRLRPSSFSCMLMTLVGLHEDALECAKQYHYTWTDSDIFDLLEIRCQVHELRFCPDLRSKFVRLLLEGNVSFGLQHIVEKEMESFLIDLLDEPKLCDVFLKTKYEEAISIAITYRNVDILRVLHQHGFQFSKMDVNSAHHQQSRDCMYYMYEIGCFLEEYQLQYLEKHGYKIRKKRKRPLIEEVDVRNVLNWESDKPYLRPRKSRCI